MDKISVKEISAEPGAGAVRDEASDFAPEQIAPGRTVTLFFELGLVDGDVVDSNFSGLPATFTVGDGNLLPGFEQAIFGLRAGEERRVQLSASQAFGEANPDNVQHLPKSRFPSDLSLEKGVVVNFSGQSGYEQAGVVVSVGETRVEVDFNHPLAGRDIVFRVRIISVSQDTLT